MEKTMLNRILQLRDIKAKNGLTYEKIMQMIEDNGDYLSMRTLASVFTADLDETSFRVETVAMIYEALIMKYGETAEIKDFEALRKMIISREKLIDSLMSQIETKEKHVNELSAFYAERKENYERTISILQEQNACLLEQIAIKDDEIRRQGNLLEKIVCKD